MGIRRAGAEVEGGHYYWNLSGWDIQGVPGERGRLRGSAGDRFVRLPRGLTTPLAATLSLLFMLFIPFIGLGMLVYVIVETLGSGLREIVTGEARGPRPRRPA